MKIDKYCKRIFEIDRKNVVALVNHLMGTTLSDETTQIVYLNKELIHEHNKKENELQKHELDYYIVIGADELSSKIFFRVEFQSAYDKNMPLRSLRYDLEVAQKMYENGCMKLKFPLGQVIYPIEFHVKDEMKALEAYNYKGDLLFRYEMDSMKVWQYSDEQIEENNLKILYALKPLNDAHKYHKKQISLAQYEESLRKYAETYRESFENKEEAMEALKVMTGYATQVVKDEDDLQYEEFLRTVVDPILLKREQLIEQYKKEGLEEGRTQGIAEGRAQGQAEGEARGEARGEAKGRNDLIIRMLKFGQSKEDVMQIAEIDEKEYEQIHKQYMEELNMQYHLKVEQNQELQR